MDNTSDSPTSATEEVNQQADATVVPMQRTSRTKKKAATTPVVIPTPIVLNKCPIHMGEDRVTPLHTFEDGDKPMDVLRETVAIVVARNKAKIEAGGFFENLVFRSSEAGTDFVTLSRDEDGNVEIRPLSQDGLSLIFQEQFCYLKPTKDKPLNHKPMPGWFEKGLKSDKTRLLFPVLKGMLHHPAVHITGTFVIREGYDPITKMWVEAGWADLSVPVKPTADQVAAAIATLRAPFEEVIFKGDEIVGADPVKKPGTDMTASEANLLSMILTAMLRREMDIAPYYIVTSTQWGTAKGLCVSIVSWIVQGFDPAAIPTQTSIDQFEKQIGRTLIDFPDTMLLQFDEPQETGSKGRLYTRQLAMMATLKKMILRGVFGHTAKWVNLQRLMSFTGNSIRPDKDMVRRVCMIELDIPHDGTLPQERSFKHPERSNKKLMEYWILGDPQKEGDKGQRKNLVEAALILIQHWIAENRPEADFDFDYPQWVHVVGGIMQKAGIKAWMSNRNEVYANADEAMRAHFVLTMTKVPTIGAGPLSARELAQRLIAYPDYQEIKDILMYWDDTWAKLVYVTWGAEEAMAFNLANLLGTVKDRMLSDGNGGRVIVSSYKGHANQQWLFTTPGTPVPAKPKGGRPPKTTP